MNTISSLRRLTTGCLFGIFTLFTFTSCEFFEDELGLSTERVVEGLKRALNIGTDAASSALSNKNGFYLDAAAKILLPEQAQTLLEKRNNKIFEQLGITSQIDAKLEDVIVNINRSAEDAAKEVAPIFSSAITDLSVTDGFDILNGIIPGNDTSSLKSGSSFDSTAATSYLQNHTLSALTGIFAPKIDASLAKDLVGNISANKAWKSLQDLYNGGVDTYNKAIDYKTQYNNYQDQLNNLTGGFLGKQKGVASFSLPTLPTIPTELSGINFLDLDLGEKMEKLEVNLAEHCTDKALSAVFGKIKLKEKEIRKDPFVFADNLIEEVFGSVFKESAQ